MATSPPTPRHHRLPRGAAVTATVLLLVPLVALAIVPVYSRESPHLWGWPFFYWYQLLVLIVTPAFTWSAYVVIKRARSEGER